MQNEKGDVVDLYIPRKCSASNRLITAKDHASVQINVGRVDENGVLTGEFDTIALCGFVRRKGLSDDAFYRLVRDKGFFDETK
ncbi:40S ribosomal protein S21 [Chondrus crispus]|uniref:40S ribosomal protein S21 n=1 Tax=Chondrus crispus TaxID=2769 RepID=R7Q390_CHOCR|nr:40S ribosomal protein S21 [Chondrus crispus]CDF32373.1 40S ribosomal protein S21 [Chondrus crispus]|eukprot:XP_005712038.1 40S ribosomal protein S21 [Chondrus crispus]